MLRPTPRSPFFCSTTWCSRTACASRPDESVLYVNDTLRIQIVAVDIAADGTAGNRRVYFQQPGSPPDPEALRP